MNTLWIMLRAGLLFLLLMSGNQALSIGSGITYHGRLMKPDGTPVLAVATQFKIQIRSPGAESCLLYEEVQTKDLRDTDGIFSVTLFDGTGTRLDSSGFSMSQIFANRGTLTFSAGTCAVGTTYSPSQTDSRSLQVSINDGGGWEEFSASPISLVPTAIEATQIGGYKQEQLIKVADGVSTVGTELNSTSWTELLALIGGTTTQYVKPSAANTFTGATTFTGTSTFNLVPKSSAVPADGADLTNKTYVDAQISAALPNVGIAGTYAKVTTDAKGRVTAGTGLVDADIPTLASAGKVSGNAINSGTISGTADINSSGNLVTTGTVQGAVVRATNLRVYEAGGKYVQLAAPAGMVGDLNFVLPVADGAAGTLMKTNGTGQLSFGALSAADIPSLDTAKLTAGTLPVARGGTGLLSYGINSVLVSNVTGSAILSLNCTAGQVIKFDGLGHSGCGNDDTGGVAGLSSLTAATAINNIDNTNFAQTWNWSTATAQNPLTITGNALITGSLLSLTSSNNALNSSQGLLRVANTGTSNAGMIARIQSNSTAGSGVTVLANGKVGIGTTSPAERLDVFGGNIQTDQVFMTSNAGYGFRQSNGGLTLSTYFTTRGQFGMESNHDLALTTNSLERMIIHSSGNVGIGLSNPSAYLHLKAGTVSAGTAPLKFTPSALMASPEAGAIEFDGSNLYYTDNLSSRKTISTSSGAGTVTNVSSSTADIAVATPATTPVLTLNTGTAANQIVRLDGSAALPGVSGANLTSLNATNVTSGTLSAARMPAFSGAITTVAGSTVATLGTIATPGLIDVVGVAAATGIGVAGVTTGTGVMVTGAGSGTGISASTGTGKAIYASSTGAAGKAIHATAATSTGIAVYANAAASGGIGLKAQAVSGSDAINVPVGNITVQGTGSVFASQHSADNGTAGGPSFNATSDTTTGMFFPAAQNLAFSTGSTERVRITDTGNVGIGTTSPQTTLQVAGVISPALNNAYSLGNVTYRFTEVYATNGVINTSDRREKKDIYDADLGLDFINKLRPVAYRWNTGVDNDVHYGLIAQEADQAIAGVPRRDTAHKTSIVTHDESSDKYGVRYSELIAPLIKAAQELYIKILGVDRQIASANEKITKLESDNEAKTQAIKNLEQQNAEIKAYLCKLNSQAPICR